MQKLFHSVVTVSGLSLELYSGESALVAIGLPHAKSKGILTGWLGRRFPGVVAEPAERRHRDFVRQLEEYFDGRRRLFDLPFVLHGSDFQKEVWSAVARVPYGSTASYGEVAHVVGRPEASRAVGAANGANPIPIVIPCHRIIGTSGALTGYGGGLPLKRRLLALEGSLPTPAVQMRLKWDALEPGAHA